MNRDELAALLESPRASMAAIFNVSKRSCGMNDLKRAAQSMGILTGGKIDSANSDVALQMVSDLAFFEPNDRGVRPFDRFLAGPVLTLPEREQEVARRMGGAFFSIFRLAGRHETAGTWVEDILDNDRRIRLVDLSVDEPDPSHSYFAVRLFDAGPFHMTLCVITSISDRMVNVFKRAHDTGQKPYRRSLPATIYGLTHLHGARPIHPNGLKFVEDLGPELRPGR